MRVQEEALKFYNQALSLRKLVGDKIGEANTINNIATLYDSQGENHKALTLYNQALSLYKTVGNRSGEANFRHRNR